MANAVPQGRSLLVVSDDEHVREALRYGIPKDFELAFARDAREAWASMTARSPSVVVVEIRSGSAGGIGLARDMSQHRWLKDVPIVMLLERTQDEWLARQVGAKATLVQPVGSDELVGAVLALVGAPVEAS